MEQTAVQYSNAQNEYPKDNQLALRFRLSDVVAEYVRKLAALPEEHQAFKQAGLDLNTAASIGGTYGQEHIDTGHPNKHTLEKNLLKSAWLHVYDGLNIETLASADDKKRFKQALEQPAPFSLDNIRVSFGDYLLDPRGNILRGLAEVFSSLDPAFKSHEKVKIGVNGLPKRVIIGQMNSFYGYGKDQLQDVLNALAALQGKPLVQQQELNALSKDENALLSEWKAKDWKDREVTYPARGVRLRRFSNGNGHLFFEPEALRDINLALAEYYGDVLPDCSEEKPTQQRPGTAISKDLQYYPTPSAVVERLIGEACIRKGDKVLEPSCGCGRILDGIRKASGEAFGVEVDHGRAMQARAKGHSVLQANFLETVPTGDYDKVCMNPPFAGKHYAKHVEHALKFLKPGGSLYAILPITARHDHGLIKGDHWHDLPVGSFRESGTNINTTILTLRAPAR